MQLLFGFLAAVPAFLVSAPAAAMLSLHIAQKASSAGAPAVLGNLGTDLVIAAVLGACSLGLCGFQALLAAQLHPKCTRVSGCACRMRVAGACGVPGNQNTEGAGLTGRLIWCPAQHALELGR